MKHSLHVWRLALPALASLALLTACGSGGDLEDRVNQADPQARFIHAATAGPAVTLFRNGNPETAATNVDYKYGSQYYDIPTTSTTFSLRTGPLNTELSATTLQASRGHKYTMVAVLGTGGVELIAIDDPYDKSVASDNARLRFMQASVTAPNVDIYVTAPNADLTALAPTVAGLAYKQVTPGSGANSVQVEGNTYEVQITAAGSKTPIFTAPVTIPKNADWIVLVIPGGGVSAINPFDFRLLVVRADGTADATDEIEAQ